MGVAWLWRGGVPQWAWPDWGLGPPVGVALLEGRGPGGRGRLAAEALRPRRRRMASSVCCSWWACCGALRPA